MRRKLSLIFIGICISLLTTGMVLAREMIQGEQCIVEADEVIEGTLFTFCQNLIVAGRVEGNIIGVALRASISGEVTENIYIAGVELTLTGEIAQDVHYAGVVLDLHANEEAPHHPVKGQLVFAALSAKLGEWTVIDGRITGVGYQLLIDGQVKNEVNYWGSAFILTNTINGDVYATVGNPESSGSDLEPLLLPLNINQEITNPGLLIARDGEINGTLTYVGPVTGEISGTVNGRINYSSTTPIIPIIAPEEGTISIFLSQFTREVMVLFTVGVSGIVFMPTVFQTPISNLRWRPVPSFVIGMLMFIVSFPIALILLLLSSIVILILALLQLDGVLIVVASFLGLLDISVIGSFYFLAIFVARTIFCLGVGRFLVRTTIGHDGTQRMNLLSMVVGVILLALLASLPAIGFLFNAAALFMGLGAIVNVFLEWLQFVRDTSYTGSRATRFERGDFPQRYVPHAEIATLSSSESERQLLPPPPDTLGLKDLPEGFDPGFFFDDD